MKCLLALLLVSIGTSGSVGDSYQSTFIIERRTNANVIHYDAKIGSDGAIDPKEPVILHIGSWLPRTVDIRDLTRWKRALHMASQFTETTQVIPIG
jgi:hypothetical protein